MANVIYTDLWNEWIHEVVNKKQKWRKLKTESLPKIFSDLNNVNMQDDQQVCIDLASCDHWHPEAAKSLLSPTTTSPTPTISVCAVLA